MLGLGLVFGFPMLKFSKSSSSLGKVGSLFLHIKKYSFVEAIGKCVLLRSLITTLLCPYKTNIMVFSYYRKTHCIGDFELK